MPNILIVDDALTDRALVSGILTKSIQCTVSEAEDGQVALSQIEKHQPDLVLTDLDMPNLNGLELVSAVREDFPLIPVILMTAKGSEEIAAEAIQKGAASYVPKRRLAEDLVTTVERVLMASQETRVLTQLMHYLSENKCEFVIHNELSLIQSLVSYLLQLLRCMPLGDETERLRVGIALEEALINAYYHGNLEVCTVDGQKNTNRKQFAERAARRLFESPYSERKIHIRADVNRNRAIFVIRDEGPGFNPDEIVSSDADIADQTSGRGLRLMHAIMDEVSFNEIGNEVTLIKNKVEAKYDDIEDVEGEDSEDE